MENPFHGELRPWRIQFMKKSVHLEISLQGTQFMENSVHREIRPGKFTPWRTNPMDNTIHGKKKKLHGEFRSMETLVHRDHLFLKIKKKFISVFV